MLVANSALINDISSSRSRITASWKLFNLLISLMIYQEKNTRWIPCGPYAFIICLY
ncbi:predicted protein [Plenodomus lingam JN3]|uniref:Predicted protein n=1 Tax=Leptosphaeria maculans (strain JN3 / isolate v23.1.3 / race Av1-4-5-6-7-8) TaxID=985895 RepID=E5A3F1_LEPMJ|nr:predicted protein [Plenodomus lingam JN3]CBX98164.1 predicted protein [Plenodomus lingam JN3]